MDILTKREQRVAIQEKLMKEHRVPLLFLRVNYPGLNKINPVTQGIINHALIDIDKMFKFKILKKIYEETIEGPNCTFLVDEDAYLLKDKAIEFEDTHPLGRLLDIDVYSPIDFTSISRSEFNMPMRKCFLCNSSAFLCIRENRHKEEAIISFIHKTYYDYIDGR